MSEEELKILAEKVDKAKDSVARAKASVKEATGEYEIDSKKTVLKRAKTNLKNAKAAYKAAKPKSAIRRKVTAVKEAIGNTARKIPVKKALTWTGMALTTVATGVGGYLLYDYFHKDGEATTGKDSM
jgi:hypothetical protein